MKGKKHLKEVIKSVYQTDRLVYPNDTILARMGANKRSFLRLCNGERKMSASEAAILAEWLGVEISALIILEDETKSNELLKEAPQHA